MTTAQVKKLIVKKINNIEQKKILDEINLFVDRKSSNNIKLNEIQRKRISKSKREFKEGLGIAHEKVMSNIEKWLKEK